jgi:hypothetical protein
MLWPTVKKEFALWSASRRMRIKQRVLWGGSTYIVHGDRVAGGHSHPANVLLFSPEVRQLL